MTLTLCRAILSGRTAEKEEKPQITLFIKTSPVFSMTTYADPEIRYADEFLEKAVADFAAHYDESDVSFRIVAMNTCNPESHSG